jgi:hypothetical protein
MLHQPACCRCAGAIREDERRVGRPRGRGAAQQGRQVPQRQAVPPERSQPHVRAQDGCVRSSPCQLGPSLFTSRASPACALRVVLLLLARPYVPCDDAITCASSDLRMQVQSSQSWARAPGRPRCALRFIAIATQTCVLSLSLAQAYHPYLDPAPCQRLHTALVA